MREIETDEGVLIFDDTIQEKPYNKKNDLICWHYDHCVNRSAGIQSHGLPEVKWEQTNKHRILTRFSGNY